MRLGFAIGAVWASVVGDFDAAIVWALLSIAFAIPRPPGLLRRWVGWDDAIAKATEDDGTLFSGRRDDDA